MNHFPPLTTSQYQHLAADLDVPVAGFPYPTQQDMKAGNAIRVLVAEREALQVRLIQQVTLVEQCMVEMNRNADMGEKAEKERDALQAMLDNAESDYRGKCAELELVHDSHDAALAKLAELEGQEPVAYEYRIKPVWLPDWQLWHPCTKPQYDDFIKTPTLHGWHYETRALYAHPKPARTLSDEEVFADDAIMSLNAEMGLSMEQIMKFVRAIEAKLKGTS